MNFHPSESPFLNTLYYSATEMIATTVIRSPLLLKPVALRFPIVVFDVDSNTDFSVAFILLSTSFVFPLNTPTLSASSTALKGCPPISS